MGDEASFSIMSPLLLAALVTLVAQSVPDGVVQRGTLSFDGHATLGDFVGATDSVRGAMTGGADLTAVRGWVEARVATLVTGNGKRDRDLRGSMEVERFPTMRFDLDGVVVDGARGDTVSVTLRGTLAIHGVRRDVALPALVVPHGPAWQVRCDFPLDLTDYAIGGLSKMLGLLKMDPHITVHVDVTFGP